MKSWRLFSLIEARTYFFQSKKLDQSSLIGVLNEKEIYEVWFMNIEFGLYVVMLELVMIMAMIPWKKSR